MDSESHLFPSLDFKADCCEIDRIVFFAEASAASAFLDVVYPHISNCLVASADHQYPLHPDLRDKVFRALAEDSKIRVIIFGLSALGGLKLATDRILVMDELIMQDFRKHPKEREQGLGLSVFQLVFLMKSFFQQWEKLPRIGNTSYAYQNFAEYDDNRFDWKASLLGIAAQKEMPEK